MRAQLPDEALEHYFEEISRTGRIYAKAKAKATALEENRKITKSFLMKLARAEGHASSRDAAEVWAYTHPQYKTAVNEWVAAIEDEVITKTDNENAIREWESWRTLCANERNNVR